MSQRAYEIRFKTSIRNGADDDGGRVAIVSAKSAARARNRLIRELIEIEGKPKIASSLVLGQMLQCAATGGDMPNNMIILMSPEEDGDEEGEGETEGSESDSAEDDLSEPQATQEEQDAYEVEDALESQEQQEKEATVQEGSGVQITEHSFGENAGHQTRVQRSGFLS